MVNLSLTELEDLVKLLAFQVSKLGVEAQPSLYILAWLFCVPFNLFFFFSLPAPPRLTVGSFAFTALNCESKFCFLFTDVCITSGGLCFPYAWLFPGWSSAQVLVVAVSC